MPLKSASVTDLPHPIIDKPWQWAIERFEWHADTWNSECYLDVTFVRDREKRTLRFVDPQDVTLEFNGHYPIHCGEMTILDICRRQLYGLNVQVTEFGASGTPLRLYAKAVVELVSEH